VASQDGSIWISNYHALDVLHGTTVTSFLGGRELPGAEVTSMFEDRMGRMWVGIDKTLTLFDQGVFRAVRRQDGGETGGISALTDDPAGNLWVISQAGAHGSLLRIEGQTIMQEITFDQLAIAKAGAMASDRESGIWVPMFNGNVAHWHDGHADIIDLHRASHTGNITGIIGAPDGSIYVSSALGVVGIRGSKWQTLDASNGLPCTAVRTILWDAEQLLLYADCGLLSVSSAEVEEWWHDPKAVLKVRAFDSFDGVQPAAASRYPKSSKSPDGRLWFANSSVLQVMDPSNVRTNQTVPLVQIEKVVADGTPLPVTAPFHLHPLTRNLEFDYSSSSFAIPQKVKYRYRNAHR
jgi:ligand-binding sensor domain-containing protein